MISEIGIIGSGSWGTALAIILSKAGINVKIWGHNSEHLELMIRDQENKKYLPNFRFPKNLIISSDLHDMSEVKILFIAVPSKFFLPILQKIIPFIKIETTFFISCTKGIEETNGWFMSQIMEKQGISLNNIAILSGPNLALEIVSEMPAASVIGSDNNTLTLMIQKLFEKTNLRIYSSNDRLGLEIGGALKNIFAIATGVSDSLGFGCNAKAALVTRSLAEMKRFGSILGGNIDSFSGLSGVGDLMATCFSTQSRNYQVGYSIGKNIPISTIIQSSITVAEGISTVKGAWNISYQKGIDTPIINAVYQVIYNNFSPKDAVEILLKRQYRRENE